MYGDSVVCAECEARLKPQLAVAPVTNQTVNFNKIDVHAPLHDEEVFYSSNRLLVSSNRIVVDHATYPTSKILAVRLLHKDASDGSWLAAIITSGLFIVLSFAIYVASTESQPNSDKREKQFLSAVIGIPAALVMVVAIPGFLIAKNERRKYMVELSTMTGPVVLETGTDLSVTQQFHQAIVSAVSKHR